MKTENNGTQRVFSRQPRRSRMQKSQRTLY